MKYVLLFCLIWKYPQEENFTNRSEAYMWYNQEDTFLYIYSSPFYVFVTEVIWHRKEAMNYDVASKVIEEFYKRVELGGFNQNQIMYIFAGV